jgi:hypothetical protein
LIRRLDERRLETKGIEQTSFSPSKPPFSQNQSAKSGALDANFTEKYPGLQEVIDVWPELPQQGRDDITRIIKKYAKK